MCWSTHWCNWGDFAKAGVGGAAARGLQLGIKTGTWQGAATGAAGGAILGGVAYAAICWW
ncbi:TPA: ComC/BlpC family peptide pheromone/bacteriocin [Streptococcus pneumoniae]|nr:ComC/BlpC family peptide pheromone/bacteriocin [Streptococcus pneumoniae]HET0781018.1 ComC/BlpC family peptide pheromone/bacteriocin [Streptococcus pneumoniae]HET1011809.1 ComC/BlpC family peptide pheromone/bacteriocin [Streptococcus pneumoniae]HET1821259.1 ComC/BlpC family peptide pheromone/bacteriocin [Streptococcus pneumoniae]HET5100625.1 ComC/BlpC family peptide pheromone/bacteriocin [Streptococcus pneumoniae]